MADLADRFAALSDAKRHLLARLLADAGTGAPAPPPDRGPDAPAGEPCLSFAQERMWMEHVLRPGSAVLNLPLCLRLRGPLDESALRSALDAVCRRHEILGTRYERRDGRPVPVHVPDAEVPAASVDLRARGSDAEEHARVLLAREAAKPFDLAAGVPLRATLVRVGEDDRFLLLVIHHVACDETSLYLIVRDLAAAYAAHRAGRPWEPAPAPPYTAFARAERAWAAGPGGREALEFWRRELAGAPLDALLPTDHPRGAAAAAAPGHHPVQVPAELADALRALAQAEGSTLFTIFFAALAAVLWHHGAGEDVLVGTPASTREEEDAVGPFLNTLVLRGRCTPELSLRQLVRGAGAAVLRAFEHRRLPFERLVREFAPQRTPGAHPLFQAMLSFHRSGEEAALLEDVDSTWVELGLQTLKFDLLLSVHDLPGEIVCGLEHDPALFRAATAGSLAARLHAVLHAVATEPEITLAHLAGRLRAVDDGVRQAERSRMRSAPLAALRAASATRSGTRRIVP